MRGLRRKLNLLEDSDFGIINKKEIIEMADFNEIKKNIKGKRNNKKNNKAKVSVKKREYYVTAPEMCIETIEYKMGKEMAEDIIRDDKTKRPVQEILCEHVNTQFGLKGYCVRVIVDAN